MLYISKKRKFKATQLHRRYNKERLRAPKQEPKLTRSTHKRTYNPTIKPFNPTECLQPKNLALQPNRNAYNTKNKPYFPKALITTCISSDCINSDPSTAPGGMATIFNWRASSSASIKYANCASSCFT